MKNIDKKRDNLRKEIEKGLSQWEVIVLQDNTIYCKRFRIHICIVYHDKYNKWSIFIRTHSGQSRMKFYKNGIGLKTIIRFLYDSAYSMLEDLSSYESDLHALLAQLD